MHAMRRLFRVALVIGGMTALAGSGSKSGLVPVGGRVTLDGQPVPKVVVTFTPIGNTLGSGSVGSADADGWFTLTDVRGSAGAYAGEYKISLYPGSTASKAGD